jgi:hypothetical protein
MKCDNCGITIPELPEDASYDEMLCDTCYRILIEKEDTERKSTINSEPD